MSWSREMVAPHGHTRSATGDHHRITARGVVWKTSVRQITIIAQTTNLPPRVHSEAVYSCTRMVIL
ncbi:hypothetical protein NSND_60039 [Nitrospira sp. ND1]|nr:hypothetical protein NSND_60039 [Nitrospira sp. ND1]